MPFIRSAITINRVEVWITNKRSNFNQARNIIAFTDLGEHRVIGNATQIRPQGNMDIPYNDANNLYQRLITEYADARESSHTNQILSSILSGAGDYEKIENARLLSENDYTINKQLGYISLNAYLQPDEVLAVAVLPEARLTLAGWVVTVAPKRCLPPGRSRPVMRTAAAERPARSRTIPTDRITR